MSSLKKQFFLDNLDSSNIARKIEFDLSVKFKNGSFKFNKDTHILLIDFKNEDTIEEDIKQVYDIIRNVSKEIDIVEREIKPTYRKVLILENLDCANCAAKIERIAKRSFDHEFIAVDFTSTRFIIETSDKQLIDSLEPRLQEIASSVDAAINVIENKKKSKQDIESFKIDPARKKYFFLGLSIFALGFIVKTFMNQLASDNKFLRNVIIYVTYSIGYILIAGDVLYGAFKNAKSGRIFDEKFLMSLATITALAVGYYDEAVFVMIFYKVGELCQQYAVNYSRKSIASLIDIQPQVANILVNGDYVEMDPMEVFVGDITYVKPGERIPLDGVIIEGEGALDVSALTGESIYKDVSVGTEVLSGSINIDGNLHIRVTKVYQDSMVAKILDLVENASGQKAKSENFISKFAKYYTPFVVIIAVVLAITLPFILPNYEISWENGFKNSILTALIFLVVSCPCALVISIPLGFFGGIGGASRQGILIKGSNYLEALNSVDTFVFDKTGTLTTGKFMVDDIISFGEYTSEELLDLAAHVEINSNHLIAKSIVDAYGADKIIVSRIKISKQTSNLGVNSYVDGKHILAGKAEYLLNNNIEVPVIEVSGSKVYLSVDGKAEGCLIIKDQIKNNAASAIQTLKEMGIKRTIMITGDGPLIAKDVSNQLGIDEYYYEMTPVDKVDKFAEIKSQMDVDSKIAYVGDGINDAPVLSRADIGIAMGGLGSDAAIEVADIVLMTDDIGKLSTAMQIAKKTRKIVVQNIILALAVKFLVLGIALIEPFLSRTVFGFMLDFLIYEALFADVGVSLIAILNSLRAMKVTK